MEDSEFRTFEMVLRVRTFLTEHVMAKAGINDALEDALDAIRQFDAIVPNVFHDDPARLAAWTSARHVERAARKPQTSTATPGSTPTPPAS